ncbi:MAG TPA: RNA methyltransferase [Thermoanaerobaculia bacterium]|nr:RNA methyltransferase [Thermoanaerobaculia bacterium]
MKTIASRHNPSFKRLREALRRPEQEIALEGRKQVEDAIAAGWKPALLVTRGPIREDAVAFTPELFDALSDTSTPQDLIGLFLRPRHDAGDILRSGRAPVVVLDAVQDPGNVGTIIRLAAAFDCAGVILLHGCADAYSPKAVRASAGAILAVPVAQARARAVLDSGLPLFAADARGAPIDPPAREAALVFGSEGGGVSNELLLAATAIRIPMSGRVESLNVAASAAILLARSFAIRGT